MHDRQRFTQKRCEILILLIERRAEQVILVSETSIDVGLVQPGLVCDGLGRGLDQPIPRYDPDGTHHKCLLHALLIQTVTLRCKLAAAYANPEKKSNCHQPAADPFAIAPQFFRGVHHSMSNPYLYLTLKL